MFPFARRPCLIPVCEQTARGGGCRGSTRYSHKPGGSCEAGSYHLLLACTKLYCVTDNRGTTCERLAQGRCMKAGRPELNVDRRSVQGPNHSGTEPRAVDVACAMCWSGVYPFNALTLLVRRQEGIRPVKI